MIKYESLEIKDYLNSLCNLRIEDQKLNFSTRSEFNPFFSSSFQKNTQIEEEYCIEKCGGDLNNEHLTWHSLLNLAF